MAASSSSAEITPQKRRKVTCDAAVGGIGHALSNAADSEEQYVLASMHAAEGTTRALAALLRNGAVQKAIMKEFNKERLILGRLLPSGVQTYNDLPRTFIWNVFWGFVKNMVS